MEQEKSTYKLPEGWIWTTIGEIGIVTSGGTPKTNNSGFWGGKIPWVTPADLSNYKNVYIEKGSRNITEIGLEYSSAKLLPKGSILFSSRAPIGYVAIAKNEISTDQGFKNIIPTQSLFCEYIYYYLKTIKPLAEKMASGTTFLELSASKFAQLPIPFPPLSEQHRIVARIEELFSELDHAEEGLKKAQKQLEVYKQALLKSAFEGKLFKKNDQETKWKQIIFTELCEVQRGFDLSLSNIVKGKYPVITSSGINGYHNEYKATGPCLIIGRSGSVGIIHYFDVDLFWPHNTTLFVKNFKNNYPKFVYYLFLQFNFKSFSSSTAVPTLDRKQFFNQIVSIPNLEEQIKIVETLESKFTLIENLNSTIISSANKIAITRQSILKKAFEGRLQPQFSYEEAATELLQKIQIEKENYLLEQKTTEKQKPRKVKPMETNKSILEVLQEANDPISPKELWLKSKHKDNIEDFYSELKEISNVINESKNLVFTESLISLKNEN